MAYNLVLGAGYPIQPSGRFKTFTFYLTEPANYFRVQVLDDAGNLVWDESIRPGAGKTHWAPGHRDYFWNGRVFGGGKVPPAAIPDINAPPQRTRGGRGAVARAATAASGQYWLTMIANVGVPGVEDDPRGKSGGLIAVAAAVAGAVLLLKGG